MDVYTPVSTHLPQIRSKTVKQRLEFPVANYIQLDNDSIAYFAYFLLRSVKGLGLYIGPSRQRDPKPNGFRFLAFDSRYSHHVVEIVFPRILNTLFPFWPYHRTLNHIMHNLNKPLCDEIVHAVRESGQCFACFNQEEFDLETLTGSVRLITDPDPFWLEDGDTFFTDLTLLFGIRADISFDPNTMLGEIMFHDTNALTFTALLWIETQKGAAPKFDHIDREGFADIRFQPGDLVVCIEENWSKTQSPWSSELPKEGCIYVVDEHPRSQPPGLFLKGFDAINIRNQRVGFWSRKFVAVADYLKSLSKTDKTAFLEREDVKPFNLPL
jgi:hypothetical protein